MKKLSILFLDLFTFQSSYSQIARIPDWNLSNKTAAFYLCDSPMNAVPIKFSTLYGGDDVLNTPFSIGIKHAPLTATFLRRRMELFKRL